MSVIVTFDTHENYAAFAAKTGLAVTDGATSVEIPWGKLKVAKNSVGAESFARLEGRTTDTVEFIMKGDIANSQVSELITLRRSHIYNEIGFLRVIGKGDKERLVPIGKDALRCIHIYLNEVRIHQVEKKGFED
jgi:site-specific recombinase XerC